MPNQSNLVVQPAGMLLVKRTVGLVLASCLFYSVVASHYNFILPLVFVFSVLALMVSIFKPKLVPILLGVALPVLPALGSGAFNIIILCLLTFYGGAQKLDNKSAKYFFYLLLFSFVLSFFRTIYIDFDWRLISSAYQFGGLSAVLEMLGKFEFVSHRALIKVLGWLVAALIFLRVKKICDEGLSSSLFFGFLIGGALSLAYAFAQIIFPVSIFNINRGPFWYYLERFSGSFSDPNAFGVFVAIFVPVLFLLRGETAVFFQSDKSKRVVELCNYVVCLGLFVISFWSGSRTQLIGFFLWFTYLSSRWVRKTFPQKYKSIVMLTGTIFAVCFVLIGNPKINEKLSSSISLISAKRVLATVHWDDASEMFFSRRVFYQIALELWQENPIFGVGLERYRGLSAKTAEKLGYDLEGWKDNANNFYLQILAEQGLLGFILVAFGIYFLWRSLPSDGSEREHIVKVAFVVLLTLFLTGPHVHFAEVRYLMACLLACVVTGNREASSLKVDPKYIAVIFSALLCFSLMSAKRKQHFGVYNLEDDPQVGKVVWTSQSASVSLCGSVDKIYIRALTPGMDSQPVHVKIPSTELIELNDTDWHTIEVSRDLKVINLHVSRVWSPSSEDPRILGVQLRWPDEAC